MSIMLMWSFKHIVILLMCSVFHLSYNNAKQQKLQEKNLSNLNNIKEFTFASEALLPFDKNKHVYNDVNDDNFHNLFDKNQSYPCLLGTIYNYTSYWTHTNGSLVRRESRGGKEIHLDISYKSENADVLYSEATRALTDHLHNEIVAFSAAGNNLTIVPYKSLKLVNMSVKFVTLRYNQFSLPVDSVTNVDHKHQGQHPPKWWNFPVMENLIELDISHCNIDYLEKEAFDTMPKLKYLYLSFNKFGCIPGDLFSGLVHLEHLDLSHIESITPGLTSMHDPSMEPYFRVIDGLTLAEHTFQGLKNLKHLDISFTKIYPTSARAFSYLGPSVEYLSLCFTWIPVLPKGIFANTSLRILDLSGNPSIAVDLNADSFEGIENTLKILAIERANIKNLDWLRNLRYLQVLKLASNNINVLGNETFLNLTNLVILDLNSNHIGNWYYRVFEKNKNLKILNLRKNNINMLTSEMYKDFADLLYLALGWNNFVCGCILRDLIEVAAKNSKNQNCMDYIRNQLNYGNTNINENLQKRSKRSIDIVLPKYDIVKEIVNDMSPLLNKSSSNMEKARKKLYNSFIVHESNNKNLERKVSGRFNGLPKREEESCGASLHNKNQFTTEGYLTMSDGEPLSFRFQLLDYEEKDYWCFNSSNNIEHQFSDLKRCKGRSAINDVKTLKDVTVQIIIVVVSICVFLTVVAVVYFKWWYIHYFIITVKNALILSFMEKQKNKNGQVTSVDNNYTYDIFVSYCDENRDWVLEELLPHLEKSREINVCLHERDFQVGISILENIISCMDRSRCLMLIISKSFLQSHWCQFEMHLAQHRLFETRKENLILILLEDIPKSKRPKTLDYLMKIKTYIKWPTGSSDLSFGKNIFDERALFWKRIRKSLSEFCEDFEETSA